jgi:UDP-2-acetamido-3-amino-2,3-dideoxy-glucuronate N-acetyltransferase
MELIKGEGVRYFGTGQLFEGEIYLGDFCEVHHGVMIGYGWPGWKMPGGPTKIGAKSRLKPYTIIGAGTVLGEQVDCDPFTKIGCNNKIGNNVQFNYGAQVHCGVEIDDDCWICGLIPENSIIRSKAAVLGMLTHRYPYFGRAPFKFEEGGGERGPVVKEYAFVGLGSVVVGDVTVGRGAYVGAGAVVTKDVEDGAIMVGNPAKRIGWIWEREGCDPELLRLLGREP